MKKVIKAIKAFDKKNTNFHSGTYWLIFLTASAEFMAFVNNATASAL